VALQRRCCLLTDGDGLSEDSIRAGAASSDARFSRLQRSISGILSQGHRRRRAQPQAAELLEQDDASEPQTQLFLPVDNRSRISIRGGKRNRLTFGSAGGKITSSRPASVPPSSRSRYGLMSVYTSVTGCAAAFRCSFTGSCLCCYYLPLLPCSVSYCRGTVSACRVPVRRVRVTSVTVTQSLRLVPCYS
jgi:hypothetical protein